MFISITFVSPVQLYSYRLLRIYELQDKQYQVLYILNVQFVFIAYGANFKILALHDVYVKRIDRAVVDYTAQF